MEYRRQDLVRELMEARRAVKYEKASNDPEAIPAACARLDEAKRALGERGPLSWDAGAPDLNRHMVANTSYSEWFASRIEHS